MWGSSSDACELPPACTDTSSSSPSSSFLSTWLNTAYCDSTRFVCTSTSTLSALYPSLASFVSSILTHKTSPAAREMITFDSVDRLVETITSVGVAAKLGLGSSIPNPQFMVTLSERGEEWRGAEVEV